MTSERVTVLRQSREAMSFPWFQGELPGCVVEAVDGGDSAGAVEDLDVGDGLLVLVVEGDRRVAVDGVRGCAVVGEFEGLDA
ncbi:hypothetical protein GCM10029964_058250 [Kibdelosporangium lantanae]